MSYLKFVTILLCLILLAGCAAQPAAQTGTPEDLYQMPATLAARNALALDLGIPATSILIHSLEPVDWPDACLGAAGAEDVCAQVVVPGYRIMLDVSGVEYEAHTDLEGTAVRLAKPQDPTAQVVENIRIKLAARLGMTLDQVIAGDVQAQDWPDGCLGLPATGEMCTEAIISGYRITLHVNGSDYVVRTDTAGSLMRIESAPLARVGDLLLTWTSADQPCHQIEVGQFGIAFGDCGAPMLQSLFVSGQRVDQIALLASTYQSFTAETPTGTVALTGTGSQTAGEAEQRSLAEWAQLMYREAVNGGRLESNGVAFTWQREGGIAGFCDTMVVYRDGSVEITSCKIEDVEVVYSRLSADNLAQLYAWVDTYAAFNLETGDAAVADGMTITLALNGAGSETMPDAEREALSAFAGELYNQVRGIKPTE